MEEEGGRVEARGVDAGKSINFVHDDCYGHFVCPSICPCVGLFSDHTFNQTDGQAGIVSELDHTDRCSDLRYFLTR